MARILPDREIRKLLGSVLIGADEHRVRPNSIELRLGKNVRFHSTGEEKEIGEGDFLKVNPGETVLICSLEKIDFAADTVQAIYPNSMFMGLITPTTTMMREGIAQATTKIDAGFRGVLNWGLRNGSMKDLILQYGEPIFKLTLFLLDADESPDVPYGSHEQDSYQDTTGIKRSTRHLPADIPETKIVSSSYGTVDPKKQLQEAGYPFNHIGLELVALHGQFEVVSSNVAVLTKDFERQTERLSDKITEETKAVSEKLNEFKDSFFEHVDAVFTRKFGRAIGIIASAIAALYGCLRFLQSQSVKEDTIAIIALVLGIVVLAITLILTTKRKSK